MYNAFISKTLAHADGSPMTFGRRVGAIVFDGSTTLLRWA